MAGAVASRSAPTRVRGRCREGAPRRALGRDRARCRRRDGVSSATLTAAPLASFPLHDVKQRSLLRSRGALLRPGFSFLFPSGPKRGADGAWRLRAAVRRHLPLRLRDHLRRRPSTSGIFESLSQTRYVVNNVVKDVGVTTNGSAPRACGVGPDHAYRYFARISTVDATPTMSKCASSQRAARSCPMSCRRSRNCQSALSWLMGPRPCITSSASIA